jgi:carboxymethylenebutenolidase
VIQYAGADVKIGTVGWCMGGSWSLQSAFIADAQAKACVMYYGMPERNKERLQQLKAPVLGLFAKQDKFITPAIVGDFETTLEKSGKTVKIKMYDADHAFANPSNPRYKKDDAEDAFNNAVEFLKQYLK